MKKYVIVGASLAVVAILVALLTAVGGSSVQAQALPQVEFLGEGAKQYTTPLEDFIVKTTEKTFVFKPGPTYQAADGERVWGVSGANGAPPTVWNEVVNLGPATAGCTVEYVGIDDDVNGIRNGFFLGPHCIKYR